MVHLETFKELVSALLVLLAVLAVEALYALYMVAHGVNVQVTSIGLAGWKLNFPLITILVLGVITVVLSSWHYAVREVKVVQVKPAKGKVRFHDLARRMKIASLILSAFAVTLFPPYVIGSNWLCSSMPQLTGLRATLVPFLDLPALWRYLISQNLSVLIAALASIIYVHKSRKPRKTKAK